MMAFNFASHQAPQAPCAGSVPPGTRALEVYLRDRYPYSFSLGILNCRPVAGTSTLSHHGKGWAYDCGLPTTSGGGARTELGMPIVELLGNNGKRLGITGLIYNRRIWRAAHPEGKPYEGVHPHHDHIHIELNPTAAGSLNGATLDAVLGPRGDIQVPPRARTGSGPATYIVQPGDTLMRIADRFGIATRDLVTANPQIPNPDVIHPDQVINLPAHR